MKVLKTLVLIAALTVSATASAQTSKSGRSKSRAVAAAVAPYDRVSVSYMNETISPDYQYADNMGLNGFSLDYIHGFSISKRHPIFLETGLGFQAGFHSDSNEYEDGDVTIKTNLMSFAVPVNLSYRFKVNPEFSIQPFFGVNAKFNISGKTKYEIEAYDEDGIPNDFIQDYESDNLEINMFDKKETGSKNATWKRFQLGWHIGAGFNLKQFWIGLSYGTDFVALCKKTNTSTFKVGVGYRF